MRLLRIIMPDRATKRSHTTGIHQQESVAGACKGALQNVEESVGATSSKEINVGAVHNIRESHEDVTQVVQGLHRCMVLEHGSTP